MRRLTRTVLTTTALLLLTPAVPAHAANVDDPNDTRGGLDIANLRVTWRPSGDVAFTVRFHAVVGNRMFARTGNWVAVFLDVDGAPGVDYTIGTRGHRGELNPRRFFVSVSIRDEATGYEYGGDLMVHRPDASSIRWVVPDRYEVLPPDGFDVAAQSAFLGGNLCDPACLDFAPELGNWLTVS